MLQVARPVHAYILRMDIDRSQSYLLLVVIRNGT